MTIVLSGVAVGVVAAMALMRLLRSFIYGVGVWDPITFVVVSLELMSVALIACYIPARRAARISPMVALRWE
jgi:ABC-type antimicrobial peptide transport system permease subunit